MRPTAAGFYPHILQPGAPPQGEVLAATTLGQDQQGATVVAYIVRKDGDAAKSNAASSANANDPKAKPASFSDDLAQATANAATATGSSAKFIKPDSLLSPLEKAQVNHLRAREGVIKKEAADSGSSDAPAPSYIYQTGPDGRSYVIGVATPLVLQNGSSDDSQTPPNLSDQAFDQGLAAYQTRLGTASPLRAGMIDHSL